MEKTRLEFVDYLKGLCICLIVVGHSLSGDSLALRAIYLFHVPAFFFVSGYLFKGRPFSKSLKRNARALLLPYAVATLIVSLKFSVDVFRGAEIVGLERFLLSFIFVGPRIDFAGFTDLQVGPVWFLLALFWAKVIFELIYKIPFGHVAKCLLMMAASAAGVFLLQDGISVFGLAQGLAGLFFMGAGAAIKPFVEQRPLGNFFRVLALITLFAASALAVVFTPSLDIYMLHFGCLPVNLTCGVFAVVFLLWLFHFLENSKNSIVLKYPLNLLAFLGRSSLFILIVHYVEFMCFDWNGMRLVADIAIASLFVFCKGKILK